MLRIMLETKDMSLDEKELQLRGRVRGRGKTQIDRTEAGACVGAAQRLTPMTLNPANRRPFASQQHYQRRQRQQAREKMSQK
jgi:hypothetical protein